MSSKAPACSRGPDRPWTTVVAQNGLAPPSGTDERPSRSRMSLPVLFGPRKLKDHARRHLRVTWCAPPRRCAISLVARMTGSAIPSSYPDSRRAPVYRRNAPKRAPSESVSAAPLAEASRLPVWGHHPGRRVSGAPLISVALPRRDSGLEVIRAKGPPRDSVPALHAALLYLVIVALALTLSSPTGRWRDEHQVSGRSLRLRRPSTGSRTCRTSNQRQVPRSWAALSDIAKGSEAGETNPAVPRGRKRQAVRIGVRGAGPRIW